MFTPVYSFLSMFTRVYLCLVLFSGAYLPETRTRNRQSNTIELELEVHNLTAWNLVTFVSRAKVFSNVSD